MKVIIMAYHNIGCIGLRMLTRHNISVEAVFTHRDNPQENRWFESVAELSRSMGIRCYYAEDFNKDGLFNFARDINPDMIFSFYYRHLIPVEILKIPRLGGINLHGSLLPKYRGRCPVNWQIINGEKESGLTLHYMEAKADAGDIIAQERVDISRDDTAYTLYRKLEDAAERLLDNNLEDIINGRISAIPQNEEEATIYGGRKPEDGNIDWNLSAEQIYNFVRALTKPYPGAFTYLDGKKLIIWKAEVFEGSVPEKDIKIGQVVKYEDSFFVKTSRGWLKLIELGKISGIDSNIQTADNFLYDKAQLRRRAYQ